MANGEGKKAANGRREWRAIGVGALVVLVVIIAVIVATTQPTAKNPASRGAGTAANSSATNAASGPPAADDRGGAAGPADQPNGKVPILISPANDASVASLNASVTFTWQRVADTLVHYNIEFQYSTDGNDWGRSEVIYDTLGNSYQRTNPFLNFKYVRWHVWATTANGNSDKSEWRRLILAGQ